MTTLVTAIAIKTKCGIRRRISSPKVVSKA
jgi:hypothetical protein